jgi:hypothetical protein
MRLDGTIREKWKILDEKFESGLDHKFGVLMW